MQATMTALGAAAVTLLAVSHVADRRRMNRRDVERVGFMPWPLISVMATIVALFAFALALKG
jgi:hypothetical protein